MKLLLPPGKHQIVWPIVAGFALLLHLIGPVCNFLMTDPPTSKDLWISFIISSGAVASIQLAAVWAALAEGSYLLRAALSFLALFIIHLFLTAGLVYASPANAKAVLQFMDLHFSLETAFLIMLNLYCHWLLAQFPYHFFRAIVSWRIQADHNKPFKAYSIADLITLTFFVSIALAAILYFKSIYLRQHQQSPQNSFPGELAGFLIAAGSFSLAVSLLLGLPAVRIVMYGKQVAIRLGSCILYFFFLFLFIRGALGYLGAKASLPIGIGAFIGCFAFWFLIPLIICRSAGLKLQITR